MKLNNLFYKILTRAVWLIFMVSTRTKNLDGSFGQHTYAMVTSSRLLMYIFRAHRIHHFLSLFLLLKFQNLDSLLVKDYTFISIKFFSDSFASSCQFQLKLFHMRWFFICDMTFSMTNRRILLTKLCILNKLVDLFFHVFTPKCVDLSFYCRINIKVITIDIEIFKWNSALPPLSIKILKITNFVLDLLNLKVLVK